VEALIYELADSIYQMNNTFDWASAISAICSLISLVAIVILLKERKEKKRPYLQVSFELVRSSLVCLVIRNVGDVPARLIELKFNQSFVEQLPAIARERAKDKNNLQIPIYPKQQWVLCMDVITSEVLSYQNTKLEVTYMYTSKDNGKRKHYTDTELINFNDYSSFLIYISETDELREEVKKLGESLRKVDTTLGKLVPHNSSTVKTQSYSNLSDSFIRTLLTNQQEIPIIEKQEDHTNA